MICQCLRLQQIIDLLAADKSQYFAQPRPIIVNYLTTLFPGSLLFPKRIDPENKLDYLIINNWKPTRVYTGFSQKFFSSGSMSSGMRRVSVTWIMQSLVTMLDSVTWAFPSKTICPCGNNSSYLSAQGVSIPVWEMENHYNSSLWPSITWDFISKKPWFFVRYNNWHMQPVES